MLEKDPIYATPSPDNPEDEFYFRRLARRKLLHFTHYTFPSYYIDPLQIVLGHHLERVFHDEIDRLMVFAPPQHGKSELVSVRFPAFWLAHRQDDPIILCSYGAAHAYDKVFSMRQVVESIQYKMLFPNARISDRTRAGANWRMANHRAVVVAAGVGGPITGYGAMLGIIDDPLKNWQEAESSLVRDRIWNWYQTTFRTRIWDGGKIILIMTRWHEDDLAGRILNTEHKDWEVVRLPAIAEDQATRDDNNQYLKLTNQIGLPDPAGRQPGEALCPSRYNIDALLRLKTDVGPIAWTGQYCGLPRMPEGNIIKRSWFKTISIEEFMEIMPGCTMVRYWDKAAVEAGGARTAGVLLARDRMRNYIVVDVVKGQWSTYNRERIMRTTAEKDAEVFGNRVVIWIENEPGSGGQDSARATIKNLEGFTTRAHYPSGSKLGRLGPFIGQAEAGNVSMVSGAWNWDWLEELTTIPLSSFWDQADATSGAFNKLAQAGWTKGMKS